jgi:cytochrome P450
VALNPNTEKNQYRATPQELAADSVLLYLAGTDTTAHALTFGVWEMLKRPELWKRLQDEVAEVVPGEDGKFAAVKKLETLPFLVRHPSPFSRKDRVMRHHLNRGRIVSQN